MMRYIVWFAGVVVAITFGVETWWLVEPAIARWQDSRTIGRRGFVPRELFRLSGERRRYMVFVPHGAPDQPSQGYPVLMFLNGVGENGDDGISQVSNNFGRQVWEMKRSFPFLCVLPQCSERGDWTAASEDTAVAMEILDQVANDYPVDLDRVYLTGVSAGGTGVLEIGAAQADRFAALVPISTAGSESLLKTKVPAIREAGLPVWGFYNGGDKPQVVDFNRKLRSQSLSEKGSDPLEASRFT